MKKLILGKGHLGTYFTDHYSKIDEVVINWKHGIDFLTIQDLKEVKPDVVINCAGKTDLLWCENNPSEAYKCNVIDPFLLYQKCCELDIKFIQMSSGCIWDGPFNKKGLPFEPDDAISPACFYAWTKASCDALMLENSYNYQSNLLIVRPRQIYSPVHSSRNTFDKLKVYPKLLNTPNSMTSVDTIIKTIDLALNLESFPRYHPFSVYDKGYSTPYEVGMLLYKAGLRNKPELLEKTDMDTWHKPKRVDAVLHDEIFENFVNPSNIIDELERVIELYKKNLDKKEV